MTVTDPVCGMDIEQEDAVTTARDGAWTLCVSSRDRQEEFEEAPVDSADAQTGA